MLQKEIDEMPHDKLYEVVKDHKGDEVLSAISLRLVRENRKYREAEKKNKIAVDALKWIFENPAAHQHNMWGVVKDALVKIDPKK